MIESIEILALSILSTSIASFYSTLGYRISHFFYGKERKTYTFFEKWRLIFIKPSSCERCDTNISTISLIPILGFMFTKGSCPRCNFKIPAIYPLLEILFFIASSFVYYRTKDFSLTILLVILWGHLVIFIITDLRNYIIDYENLPFLLLLFILFEIRINQEIFTFSRILVFFGFSFSFTLLYFLSGKNFGLGDALLISFLSFGIDHPYWILFLNSTFITAVFFTFIFRDRERSFLKHKIPLGVYIGLGAFITTIFKIDQIYK